METQITLILIAQSYSNLGDVNDSQEQYDKAETYYIKSLEIRQRQRLYGNSDHPDIATSYKNLGSVYDSQLQYDKAETYNSKSNGDASKIV